MPGSTILVCDDEPALRELMRAAIGGAYRFVEAADAPTAIEEVRRVRPDLVLLDVMLPGGSGLDVLREIRGDPALDTVRVAVISAWDAASDREAAAAAGADAFVSKPFLPEELETLVAELLAEAG